MNADFLDAHLRHMADGEFLYQTSRLANADQLFGFAVECGLKKLMNAFGMYLGGDGSPAINADKKHADQVWARYETYRSSSVNGANYVLPTPCPFQDWSASQRYAKTIDISRVSVEAHRTAAAAVEALVKKAQLEGLL
ncbi:SAM-dependent methyltransferase [Pseudomonas chlororaphis]|uniref:SAM-dependent methyltransferase n=1 Tax=Pseudomonas chlororaphis TaxID=587753 RepID=UPI000F582010|nr:SAM-dependent methyltransferase [Pseudomonas chlororaphis]